MNGRIHELMDEAFDHQTRRRMLFRDRCQRAKNAADETGPLHTGEFGAHRIRGQSQLRSHLLGRQTAPSKKSRNATTARLKKLLLQHVLTLSVVPRAATTTRVLTPVCLKPSRLMSRSASPELLITTGALIARCVTAASVQDAVPVLLETQDTF